MTEEGAKKESGKPLEKLAVNVTGRVLTICSPANLVPNLEKAISTALHLVLLHAETRSSQEQSFSRGVTSYFDQSNRTSRPLDEEFLQAILLLTAPESRNTKAARALGRLDVFFSNRRVSASSLTHLKRFGRLLLVTLWLERVVLLPSTFSPGPTFVIFDLGEHELLGWLLSYDSDSPINTNQKDSARRLRHYGPRLLLATCWHRPEDVDLAALAELHRHYLLHRSGQHPDAVGGIAYPWGVLPIELQKTFPSRVSFAEHDLRRFATWMTARASRTDQEFGKWSLSTSEELVAARAARAAKKKRVRSVAGQSENVKGAPRSPKSDYLSRVLSAAVSDEDFFKVMAKMKPRPRSVDWRVGVPVYPGREYVDVEPLSTIWIQTFRAFLNYRRDVGGCRTEVGPVGVLGALADYLFGYLPFWFENHPNTKLVYPAAPKDLKRFAFCVRYEVVSRDEAPGTLVDFLRLRRKGESLNEAIRLVSRYLGFVASQYLEDETVAGAAFRPPIEHDLDVPWGRRSNKSNKAVIPRRMFGYLLFFSYAVERFGTSLLQKVIAGELDGAALRAVDGFFPAAFGERLLVPYRGEHLEVEWLPNLFTWNARDIDTGQGECRRLVVPHLSALHLCLLSLESGLRFQSGQWLDHRTWDSKNQGVRANSDIFELFVNTDKSMVNPWETLLFPRTREMLLREHQFQRMCADRDTFEPVEYEGAPSPFGLIKPLFRGPSGGKPITDDAYYRVWRSLLFAFEKFYVKHTGEHVELFQMRGVFDDEGRPLIEVNEAEDGALYCPMRLYSVFTPHSCRTTFVTHREGVMPLEFIAELVGHGSPVTTAHYSKPEKEDIVRRSIALERQLVGDFMMFDAGPDGVHVRADKPDSALRKAFQENREAAVHEFRFIPGLSLWSTETLQQDDRNGMKLLRSTHGQDCLS